MTNLLKLARRLLYTPLLKQVVIRTGILAPLMMMFAV